MVQMTKKKLSCTGSKCMSHF